MKTFKHYIAEGPAGPYNMEVSVADLESRAKRDRVDIAWEHGKPGPGTKVTVDDEKHGIWALDGQYLGRCIVWGD